MQKIRSLFTSDFVRHNAIFFVGTMLVGVGNYLFYPALSRVLEPLPFGEVQALAALFLQLLILLSVMGQVTVNVIANYTDERKKQAVLFELERLALLLMTGVSLVLAILSPHLKDALQFQSVVPFLVLLLALIVTVPGAFRNAYLRAHQKFGAASVAQLIGAYGKVVLGLVLTYAGFKVGGAMWAIFIAQVLTWAYATYAAKKVGYHSQHTKLLTVPQFRLVLPELKFALLVLVSFGAITLLSSLDVFVVRHYFSPQVAGEYAGISTVAKMIFFFTASVAQVMFTSIKMQGHWRENRRMLVRSFLLVGAMSTVAVLLFSLFPKQIVGLLMGNAYTAYAYLLGLLSVAMLGFALLNVIVTYYVALRIYAISIILIAGLVFVSVLMAVHHGSLRAIINNLILTCVGLGGSILVWRTLFSNRKDKHAAVA